jgi:hypothetical protein
MGRDNTIRGFPVHGAGVPFSGNRDTKGIAMTVNNPVAQPNGVVEAVELLPCPFCGGAARQGLPTDTDGGYMPEWEVYCDGCEVEDGTWIPAWNRTAPSDIEYIRAPTPDSIAEKARRVVDALSRGNWLLADVTEGEIQQMVAIVTTEFGVGGGDS